MAETIEQKQKSYLSELEIKDQKWYSSNSEDRAKAFSIKATFWLDGKKIKIEDVNLPEEAAARICRIVEQAAFGDIKQAVENTALALEAIHQEKIAIAETPEGTDTGESDIPY